ncbi:MAG: glycosyltransferase family 4 protein [Clostridia bacterium]|nr:glycosyltransferase family 4 protein [Clostridia bacterium]
MLVFVSNFLNHHQTGLCAELLKLTGGEFTFIATEPIPKERTNMGYRDMNGEYPFVFKAYESEAARERSLELCKNADIAIIGSASDDYIKLREKDKITFKYSERPYKNTGFLKSFLSEARHHYRFINKKIYLLCASAYTAYDHAKFGMYKGKTYKWGYFPEAFSYDIDKLLNDKESGDEISLLWAGRIIDWKHAEVAVRLAVKLHNNGIKCRLKIIGTGNCEEEIRALINRESAGDYICLAGPMPPEGVREEMKKAKLYFITSDKNEGWGAVLNEAMNSGCCCFANAAVGAAPFLINDGENGFVYTDEGELYKKVLSVVGDKEKLNAVGKAAYLTISGNWTAAIAAKRLLDLSAALAQGKDTPFDCGPCSKAEVIKG